MKTVLSWIVAIVIALLLIAFFWKIVIGVFKLAVLLILLIPVIIIAIPIFFIIRKKVFK